MNKEKTLKLLGKEREYEERLVLNIIDFCSESLDSVSDIRNDEKEEIKRVLMVIADESKKHSRMFEGLINGVLENEKDSY